MGGFTSEIILIKRIQFPVVARTKVTFSCCLSAELRESTLSSSRLPIFLAMWPSSSLGQTRHDKSFLCFLPLTSSTAEF